MMRNLAVLAVSLVLAAPAHAADPVIGSWKTQPDDNGHFGFVDVEPCGAEICGVIGKAYDGAGKELASENVGKQMIWAMQAEGGGQYKGGKIWAPDRNKTYNSRMALNGDTLKVEGCVLGICRGQTWTRVK